MAFAYVERIMDAPDQSYAAATSLSIIEEGLENLKLVGFDPIVVCDFSFVLTFIPDFDAYIPHSYIAVRRFL